MAVAGDQKICTATVHAAPHEDAHYDKSPTWKAYAPLRHKDWLVYTDNRTSVCRIINNKATVRHLIEVFSRPKLGHKKQLAEV